MPRWRWWCRDGSGGRAAWRSSASHQRRGQPEEETGDGIGGSRRCTIVQVAWTKRERAFLGCWRAGSGVTRKVWLGVILDNPLIRKPARVEKSIPKKQGKIRPRSIGLCCPAAEAVGLERQAVRS